MSDFTELQWARAGAGARARSNAKRRPIREAVRAASRKGLEPVPFVSARARELADSAGLAWPNFRGEYRSATKGYTAADVRRIISGLEA